MVTFIFFIALKRNRKQIKKKERGWISFFNSQLPRNLKTTKVKTPCVDIIVKRIDQKKSLFNFTLIDQ